LRCCESQPAEAEAKPASVAEPERSVPAPMGRTAASRVFAEDAAVAQAAHRAALLRVDPGRDADRGGASPREQPRDRGGGRGRGIGLREGVDQRGRDRVELPPVLGHRPVAERGQPGDAAGTQRHRRRGARDRDPVDRHGVAGRHRVRVEGERAGAALVEGGAAVGVDRHAAVGPRHRGDAELGGELRQDPVAVVEAVGDVPPVRRAGDHREVHGVEPPEQVVDRRDRGLDRRIGVRAHAPHGGVRVVEAAREGAGGLDRRAGEIAAGGLVGGGLERGGERAEPGGGRGRVARIAHRLREVLQPVEAGRARGRVRGRGELAGEQGLVARAGDDDPRGALARHQGGDLARVAGVARPRHVAGGDGDLARRGEQRVARGTQRDLEAHAAAPLPVVALSA
jgi:hypothetical protein